MNNDEVLELIERLKRGPITQAIIFEAIRAIEAYMHLRDVVANETINLGLLVPFTSCDDARHLLKQLTERLKAANDAPGACVPVTVKVEE